MVGPIGRKAGSLIAATTAKTGALLFTGKNQTRDF